MKAFLFVAPDRSVLSREKKVLTGFIITTWSKIIHAPEYC